MPLVWLVGGSLEPLVAAAGHSAAAVLHVHSNSTSHSLPGAPHNQAAHSAELSTELRRALLGTPQTPCSVKQL
jgi:hypothetical protein